MALKVPNARSQNAYPSVGTVDVILAVFLALGSASTTHGLGPISLDSRIERSAQELTGNVQ